MRQPSVDNQLGGSYITDTQVQNDSCQVSICCLDSGVQEYLKNHFNEHLNDKVYNMFKELFGSINVHSIKETLPKVSIYNNTIARFVDEKYSKYGMALTIPCLEPCEVGHWAEMFQVAKGNKEGLGLPLPQQVPKVPQQMEQPLQSTQQPAPTAITTPPPVQTQQTEQQAETDRLTNVAAQWSLGEEHSMDNYSHTSQYTHHQSSPSMSQLCQTTTGRVGITTTKAGKVTILIEGRYLSKEGFLSHHITTMLITPISYMS